MYKNLINNTITQNFDNAMMKRCVEIAQNFRRNVKSNPTVGAVITCHKNIVGEGAHELYGKAHAEVNAVNNAISNKIINFTHSCIYVTLEPCFHHGKTPPCVNLIIEKKIPRVVIGCIDPFEKVAGRSIELLRNHGVEVVVGVMKKECRQLIRPFVVNQFAKRPYIILKYAQSADGFVGKPEEQVWLTNSFSKHLVHRWRSECDGILVGTRTALIDNPKLDNRLYFGQAPTRVLIDKNLSVATSSNVYNASNEILVLNNIKKENINNIKYIQLNDNEWNVQNILEKLYQNDITKLIIEGGSDTIQRFIDASLWDEARVFSTDKRIERGIVAPQLTDFEVIEKSIIKNDTLEVFYCTKTKY